MSEGKSFWDELKERRVVRVALVYLPIAWVLVLTSSELTDILALPDWTPRLILVLLVLGFPFALVMAWAFQMTEGGVKRAPATVGSTSSRMAFMGGLAVGLVSLAAVAFIVGGPSGDEAPPGVVGGLDPGLVVVYPLRAQVPPELEYLGSGLSELLSVHFDGEVGPRSVSTQTVLAAAQDGAVEAEAVARSLGAATVVTGSVVGSATHIVVQVELQHLDGTAASQQERAEGHPDSLTAITNELAAKVLGREAGEYREALPFLSDDVDAVKSYLAGRQSWRDGEYWDAVAEFDAAIAADSTFALAAIGRADAGNMAIGAGGVGSSLSLADRHRDRLPAADRLYLDTRRGTGEPFTKTLAERLAEHDALTQALPDRVEAWYFHAEYYMHRRYWGHSDWADRALALFGRALQLDPNHIPSLEHVFFVRTMVGPADELQRVAARMQEARGIEQIYGGLAAGTGEITLDPAHLRGMDDQTLGFAPGSPAGFPEQTPADFLTYAEAAIVELHRRAVGTDEVEAALDRELQMNQMLGRPARVRALLERLVGEFGLEPLHRNRIRDALWGVGHPEQARVAADGLARRLGSKPSSEYSFAELGDLQTLEIADFVQDPSYTGGERAGVLRRAMDRTPRSRALTLEAFAHLFDAWRAVRVGEGGVGASVDRIDEINQQGPSGLANLHFYLALATMLEEHGDPARALSMLDRRNVFQPGAWRYDPEIWAMSGRLAEAIGDTERAIKEYRRYVKVRAYSGPELQPELERIRAALARLEAG